MALLIGSDHGGFRLKESLKKLLDGMSLEYSDIGCYDESSVDYPDIAQKAAAEIVAGRFQRGILICGTGIGMSIAANRTSGVRAALCGDVYSALMSREHNDANILCLGERVLGEGLAGEIVTAWLGASFAGGRHERRVAKLDNKFCGGK